MEDEEGQAEEGSPDGSAKQAKPKLTKEEKAALAEKKFLESLAFAFRSQLEREIKFTDLSLARGNKGWVTTLTNMQMADMKQELIDWKVTVDRIFDRKNYRIKKLLNALDMAEEQHKRSQSKHCAILDFLIMFCNDMHLSCKSLYEFNASDMIDIFYQECIAPEAYADYIRRYYENLYNCDNLISLKVLDAKGKRNLEKKENIINLNIGVRYDLRDSAVSKMNSLFIKLEKVFKEIESDKISLRPKDEYDRLMERQSFHEKELIRIQQLTEARQTNVFQLQKKLANQELSYVKKIKMLRSERMYFSEKYRELKHTVKKDSAAANILLRDLSFDGYNVLKKLQKISRNGELLLSLALNCRKFQTEKEKVQSIPEPKIKSFGTSSLNEIKEIDQSLITQMEVMERFNRLASIAGSHLVLLKKERTALQVENQKYFDVLKRILQDAKSGLK